MSLAYFVFLEIPLGQLDVFPISLPPLQQEKAFLSFIALGVGGAECPYEMLEAERERRAWALASLGR